MIRVWKVGDHYWTFGEFASAEEAMQPVIDKTGMDEDEIHEGREHEIRPCTDDELEHLRYRVDFSRVGISFRERLAEIVASGDTSPDIFACTEE